MNVFSEYFDSLQGDVLLRHLNKISIIGDDPFTMQDLKRSIESFSSVNDVDIHNYSVNKTSFYTRQELKATKSLDSFQWFLSSWLKDIKAKVVNKRCVVVGLVRN
ncbi:hypothetical protein Zmor_026286 [Zophobas morio]|uniref:Uncharacterized protein n=1 Tax=Zophobas morio TaxID=2755281 RepID=A0AA38HT96_9CUCU|nr:hypothetical protein Zmor_026286 [Zophobas morio]